MKPYSAEFRDRLTRTVHEIESKTSAEIIVVVQSSSAEYYDIPLRLASAFSFISFGFLMLSPYLFRGSVIFAGTLLAFAAGACAGFIPALRRAVAGRKRLGRNVEIMARAVFQKAGLHHTRRKVGVLIFFSLLERQVVLLPDRGVEQAVPLEVWKTMRESLQAVFRSSNPVDSLPAAVAALSGFFALYLPKGHDNIDELPEVIDLRFGEQ